MRKIGLIGYSGHAFVVEEVLNSQGVDVFGYFEKEVKKEFSLTYLGDEKETQAIQWLAENDFIVALGDNQVRGKKYADILSLKDYTRNSDQTDPTSSLYTDPSFLTTIFDLKTYRF